MKKIILYAVIAVNAVYECQVPNSLWKWFNEYELRYDDDEVVQRLKQELANPENKIAGTAEAKEVEQSNGLKSLVGYKYYRVSDSTVENFRALSDWSVDENLNCPKNQLYLTILKHCINQESGSYIRRSPFLGGSAESSRNSSPYIFNPVSGKSSPFSPTGLSRLRDLD